jgi:uncharacterized membrane protein
MNPDLAQVLRAIEDLSRRVERLEQLVQGRAVRTDRPYVIPSPQTKGSLESRVGAQYLNRAGIIALLVGISFFLHWAFSNNWIGPLAVVCVGLLGGAALFALGEWFLHCGYKLFGFSLEGLGIATLYLTLWVAFQFYHLVPATVAFGGMIVLTIATAVAAIIRNSEALAVFAAIGGFGTPLLLSTGGDLEIELFTYVIVLCLGMLATLGFRPWTRLLVTSFAGALAVSVVWFVTYYRKSQQLPTLIFFCALFAVFAAASIIAQRVFVKGENLGLSFVPAAAALFFLLGTGVILDADEFTLIAQIAALALLFASWRWCRGRLRATYFTLGIILSAASIPVWANAHWTTSAIWLAYGVLLMLFGFARKLSFVRWLALLFIGITVLKVFFVDLASLGQGYRILALSVLGVALLSLSFLYQRDWLGLRKQ